MDRVTNGTSWYALAVKPRHEKSSAAMLRYKGLEEFVPLSRQLRRWSDRFKEVELPLLPGYVFCRFGPRERSSVVSTPGVSFIVGAGNVPLPITEAEIDALRSVVSSGLPAEPWPYLEAGARVRIREGPLQGLDGIFVETKQHHRLVLSVTLLRRSVAVEVDSGWVAPLAAARAGSAAGSGYPTLK